MTIERYNLTKKCSGCFACYNSCPVKAIELPLNKEGFYFPVIDVNKCVNCSKCVKVCSASDRLMEVDMKEIDRSCYSYQAEDEIREKSSSGGVFYKLATHVIGKGGIVFGARYNPDKKEVEHCSSEKVSLDELLKSKYVQSKIGDTYAEVKTYLQNDRLVLFVGTPCQVYGLKAYLGKNYDRLYTMDFVCHGVPSSGYFKDWLNHIEKESGHRILNVTFREKDDGWRNQIIKIYFENSTQKVMKSKNNYYYRYFLSNIILRKSCFHCIFPENRYSDFTVKDYWEISKDDNKGISAIIVNSGNGQIFLDKVLGKDLNLLSFDKMQQGFVSHDVIKEYSRYEWLREFYLKKYEKFGFEKTVLRYNRILDFILESTGRILVLGGELKSKFIKAVKDC